ncbi:ulp1 protease family, C-terminal catalytic domain-containing protein [Tanacetum coccineum]
MKLTALHSTRNFYMYKVVKTFWLNQDTWKFLSDNEEKAKKTQLSKVNRIHRSFRTALVNFVRLDMKPFATYKYMPKDLKSWEKFVAYTNSEEFLIKSEKAKKSARQNKDPSRVGQSGYAELRALWKANKEQLIEKIPLLGSLQSERSILHVLARRTMNKETGNGIKELTSVVRERLDALINKEKEMKANGTYYITGNDPLIGVVGKEHGGRTRSSMAGKIMADVKPEMDELRADIATLKKFSNGMPSGVSGHITVDRFDEIECCDVMTIHFGTEVKVGKGIIYPTNVHGVPMEPGYIKIQVNTVYPGWEGLKVPRPTDKVMFLGDATKDAPFNQWPKNYLKVLPRMSLSLDTPQLCHPYTSSSPPLHHPSTTGCILDSLNRNFDKKPSIYSLIPLIEAEWNLNMVKCPQQEGTWECGYYVAIAMFELFFEMKSNFLDNVWDDMKPRTMQHIDQKDNIEGELAKTKKDNLEGKYPTRFSFMDKHSVGELKELRIGIDHNNINSFGSDHGVESFGSSNENVENGSSNSMASAMSKDDDNSLYDGAI